MSANVQSVFPLTPNCPQARTTGLNAARDGSTSTTAPLLLFTAGTNGSRVDKIRWENAQVAAASSTSTAMVARVFISDNAGANLRLLIEVAIASVVSSTTAIGAFAELDFINGITNSNGTITNNGIVGGLIMQTGQLLKITQSVYNADGRDQMDVSVRGGDF